VTRISHLFSNTGQILVVICLGRIRVIRISHLFSNMGQVLVVICLGGIRVNKGD
jgi:hypothetical protein